MRRAVVLVVGLLACSGTSAQMGPMGGYGHGEGQGRHGAFGGGRPGVPGESAEPRKTLSYTPPDRA